MGKKLIIPNSHFGGNALGTSDGATLLSGKDYLIVGYFDTSTNKIALPNSPTPADTYELSVIPIPTGSDSVKIVGMTILTIKTIRFCSTPPSYTTAAVVVSSENAGGVESITFAIPSGATHMIVSMKDDTIPFDDTETCGALFYDNP